MILIVGAGLSGISLVRYLYSHNVPFRIFDQAPAHCFQGFGISLRDQSIPKLLALLDIDEQTFKREVAIDRKLGANPTDIVDAITEEVFPIPKPQYSHSAYRNFRANRERLRRKIQGEVKVEFVHKLIGIQRTDPGVSVEFSNGVRAEGIARCCRRSVFFRSVNDCFRRS